MNDVLRERILRRLETLPDERVYQVLDFVEFLESRYAARQATSAGVFQRFAEGVEDTLRAGKVSAATIGETMSYLSKAMGVLSGAVAAGKSVATDVVNAASRPPGASPGASAGANASSTTAPSASTAPPAPPTPAPSSPSPPMSGEQIQ